MSFIRPHPLVAEDKDEGSKGKVVYELVGGNEQGFFILESDTGWIYLEKQFSSFGPSAVLTDASGAAPMGVPMSSFGSIGTNDSLSGASTAARIGSEASRLRQPIQEFRLYFRALDQGEPPKTATTYLLLRVLPIFLYPNGLGRPGSEASALTTLTGRSQAGRPDSSTSVSASTFMAGSLERNAASISGFSDLAHPMSTTAAAAAVAAAAWDGETRSGQNGPEGGSWVSRGSTGSDDNQLASSDFLVLIAMIVTTMAALLLIVAMMAVIRCRRLHHQQTQQQTGQLSGSAGQLMNRPTEAAKLQQLTQTSAGAGFLYVPGPNDSVTAASVPCGSVYLEASGNGQLTGSMFDSAYPSEKICRPEHTVQGTSAGLMMLSQPMNADCLTLLRTPNFAQSGMDAAESNAGAKSQVQDSNLWQRSGLWRTCLPTVGRGELSNGPGGLGMSRPARKGHRRGCKSGNRGQGGVRRRLGGLEKAKAGKGYTLNLHGGILQENLNNLNMSGEKTISRLDGIRLEDPYAVHALVYNSGESISIKLFRQKQYQPDDESEAN
ncbi:unnamed protein product [Protopolystoma xenopodis]|uniref:Cadherin domain-containing protein n=1 Tax=Protopolystoma xenopodis TaxID=117903 RepID=A0A448WH04_9PLAT|nr:unnamed protein product [Protopolystoma xenopodis]